MVPRFVTYPARKCHAALHSDFQKLRETNLDLLEIQLLLHFLLYIRK